MGLVFVYEVDILQHEAGDVDYCGCGTLGTTFWSGLFGRTPQMGHSYSAFDMVAR